MAVQWISQQFLRQKHEVGEFQLERCFFLRSMGLRAGIWWVFRKRVPLGGGGFYAAAGTRSVAGGVMMPMFWISVCGGSSW
jgi:hypothetical protein